MKKSSPLAVYKTARSILWILLIMSAANVLTTLLGTDTSFIFTNFITYLAAVYARVFYDYTRDPVYLVAGILIALVILVVYLLCCLLSKKRRGWHRRPGAVLRGHRRHAPLLYHQFVFG